VQQGFFTRLENEAVAFSLKSQGFHYEILFRKDDESIIYGKDEKVKMLEDFRIQKRNILEDKDNSRL
jgi:hypothetical protein